MDTGHEALNQRLLQQGWPVGSLVEVCQENACGQGEWLLLGPALSRVTEGQIILLNPPALPLAQGLLQAGVDVNRLLVVKVEHKRQFLSSFVELARSASCSTLLAWSPKQPLTYTELRKCLLASSDRPGLYVLFRHLQARLQSSPAALRLIAQIGAEALEVNIFKQRGMLARKTQSLALPLPASWQGAAPHSWLDQVDDFDDAAYQPQPRHRGIRP